MNFLQVSTYDNRGGAGRAAYRLHKGILALGLDSRMVVRFGNLRDGTVAEINGKNFDGWESEGFFLQKGVQEKYINDNRTELSGTLFSFPYPGYDISGLDQVKQADVVNLHWVAFFQSPVTLNRLMSTGKQIVWTMHDMNAFTGGCHYSAGCQHYADGCLSCPQLLDDPCGLPSAVLKDKIELLRAPNLTIVSPSQWMADCARRSQLFKDRRIEVIPNAVETDVFDVEPKSKAKSDLGIDPDAVTLLFGVEDGNEKRKGFHVLIEAFGHFRRHPAIRDLVDRDKIRLLCFGRENRQIDEIGIPAVTLGYLEDKEDVARAYCAADVYLLPTLEDNFPNTVLEAMGCGTPVIAFDVGGIREIITHEKDGLLLPPGNLREMADSIANLVVEGERRRQMGTEAREVVKSTYTLKAQAESYAALYRELVNDSSCSAFHTSVPNEARFAGTDPKATLDDSVGANVSGIYEKMLYASLRRFAVDIFKEFTESEKDRAQRHHQINQLTALVKNYEQDNESRQNQIDDLTRMLKNCEADREARHQQINDLNALLKDCEADRGARLEQIHELGNLLEESERDRAARLERMNDLEGMLAHLSAQIQEKDVDIVYLNAEIQNIKSVLENLEQTFVVQKARKLNLIKIEPYREGVPPSSGKSQSADS